jgi:DNA-binding transcriptional LysR family regulator
MELRHLRYFCVVGEELHFGRAAARLHMEPQPLNFQMKQLERELGFPLFTHEKNRTHLTAAGESFLVEARRVLDAADRAVEVSARVARGESGVLRIGFPNSTMHYFLAPTIKKFHEQYPNVSFDLKPLRFGDQSEALRRGELDVAFGIVPEALPEFAARPIARATPRLAVASSDPLAALKSITWNHLQGRSAVGFTGASGRGFLDRVDAMLAEHGIEMTAVQVAPDFDTVLTLVAAGVGIAIVPVEPPDGRGNVTFVALPDDVEAAEIAMIWRRNDDNPLRDRFVDFLPELEPLALRSGRHLKSSIA